MLGMTQKYEGLDVKCDNKVNVTQEMSQVLGKHSSVTGLESSPTV